MEPRSAIASTSARRQVSKMALNLDILLLIMSQYEPSEHRHILRLMCTCHALYEAGAPLLLRRRPQLLDTNRLLSFHAFMFRDKARRFRYLQSLTLCPYVSCWQEDFRPEELHKAFAEILEHATALKELRLWYPDYVLHDKSPPPSVISLPSLERLHLINTSDTNQCWLLRAIKESLPELKMINVRFPGHTKRRDPILLLKWSLNCLQELRVDGGIFVKRRPGQIQYPHLSRLYASGCIQCRADILYDAFPSLRLLKIDMMGEDNRPFDMEEDGEVVGAGANSAPSSAGVDENNEDEIDEVVESRRARSLWNQTSSGSWKILDTVRASIDTAYLLGVRCKVKALELCQSRLYLRHRRKLQEILTLNRPSAISMLFRPSEVQPLILGDLLSPARSSLNELSLRIEIHEDNQGEDTISELELLFLALSNFSIRVLRLDLQCTSCDMAMHNVMGHYIQTDPEEYPRSCRFGHSLLHTLDLDAVASEAMQSIPSLRQLCITTQGSKGMEYWEIRSEDANRMLVKLAEWEGKEAIASNSILFYDGYQ